MKNTNSHTLTSKLSDLLHLRLIIFAAVIVLSPSAIATTPEQQPLLTNGNFQYSGAFRLPVSTFGASRLGFLNGTMAINSQKNSFFVIGHDHHQAIAEFSIPEVVNSQTLSDLKMASAPIQNFEPIFSRVPSNPDNIDKITGLELVSGQLIVHGTQYYDGDANNTDTTLIIRDPDNLDSTAIDGFFKMDVSAHAAGWMSEIPPEWQSAFSGEYITGFASNYAINSRNSIGPTAFLFNPDTLINNADIEITTTTMLDFSSENRLHDDSFNTALTNDLWTEISKAKYGFIVPGTSTYVTIGSSGGHASGIDYKITQSNGHLCGGPCSIDYKDNYNYIWFWDANDLIKVKNGLLQPHNVKPYSYGKFDTPFQSTPNGYSLIVGADYDKQSGRLYILLEGADREQNIYEAAPVMLVYNITTRRPDAPEGIDVE